MQCVHVWVHAQCVHVSGVARTRWSGEFEIAKSTAGNEVCATSFDLSLTTGEN